MLRLEEPVAFRGGALIDAWKCKQRSFECSNSRGVTVGDCVGKKLHSWYRQRLFPRAYIFANLKQYGGCKARGTDI